MEYLIGGKIYCLKDKRPLIDEVFFEVFPTQPDLKEVARKQVSHDLAKHMRLLDLGEV